MRSLDVWSFIKKEITQNNNTVLLVVVERKGSSPGAVGFKMAVSESGAITGSIGGGSMEYSMVELARETAKSGKKIPFLKRQIHTSEAGRDKSGLICSGQQTHVFLPINKNNIEIINTILGVLGNGNNGAFELNQNGFSFNEHEILTEKHGFQFIDEDNWKYFEQIGLKPTLYIFGAGHVSLQMSEIFRLLDFNVVVFDNRNELSTFEDNKHAHRKEIIDYTDVAEIIPEGENSYVVIMTVGHESDELILKQLVTKKLKYLGMMGSKSKVRNIFNSLISQKISKEDLSKVDAPIGIAINSKTTTEIAISVAAKVIQCKNGEN